MCFFLSCPIEIKRFMNPSEEYLKKSNCKIWEQKQIGGLGMREVVAAQGGGGSLRRPTLPTDLPDISSQ